MVTRFGRYTHMQAVTVPMKIAPRVSLTLTLMSILLVRVQNEEESPSKGLLETAGISSFHEY